MYDDYIVRDRWTGQELRCLYQAQMIAIATRHADAVDYKFLVGDRPVWIALPHPAWSEYKQRTGNVLTDPLAIQVAGRYLKSALESGLDNGREMYSLDVEETLRQVEGVLDDFKQRQGARARA